MIKVNKEMLNELLRYISEDNQKYGLIFKITYIYGRNIGEVLKLRKRDVDLKHNALDFMLPTESVSFMLHPDIKEDLINYIESKNLTDEDYIFINEDKNVAVSSKDINIYSKKLNVYLTNIIRELNKDVFIEHCPSLVNRDFKNLRGQHLFIDGADIKTVNELYRNKNIQSTKDNIDYKNLMKLRFPCDNVRKIFYEFTDLNVYSDRKFDNTDLFTICNKENKSIVIEYDYNTGVINYLGNNKELFEQLSEMDINVLNKDLHDLKPGNYRYVGDLRIIKN